MNRLIVAAVAASLLAACSSTEEDKRANSAAHCADVRADRWIDVPLAVGQPTMRIPQPPNWESEPEFIKPPMKLVLRNNALADGNGVPAITVATGEAIEPDQAPEEMLNDSIAGFADIGAQNILQRAVTVCGYSARRVTYTADRLGATVIAVAVPLEGKMSVVIVAAQSVTPQNRTFQLDSERVLSGIQIGP
ncbi:hypothetical protein MFTT_30860 [Mycolicibacterium fortuitum subsp. fortuitum]|nr:hypothetical protein MFTT_30860 [Mycolicibacterium fortuitum subsp. fortuitum]